MFQHDNAQPHVAGICTQFLLAENVPIPWPAYSPDMSPIEHVWCLGCSEWTCTTECSSSSHNPTTSHSHWIGVGQHSTGHNQQPDQLYVKEMCRTVWGKRWSHQTLTGFLIHAPTLFLGYLWPTNAYLYSQWCEIHRLGPDMNSVKSLKLLHVVFTFLCILQQTPK